MNENEAEQVKGFRYMVKLLIEIGSPTVVGNESPAHAKVLLEEMFNAAKKTAYVYCGRISDAVWGGDGVSAAVKGAIDRGVDVRFIVQHPDKIPAGSRVKAILDESRIAVHSSRSFAQINSHFAVFDGRTNVRFPERMVREALRAGGVQLFRRHRQKVANRMRRKARRAGKEVR